MFRPMSNGLNWSPRSLGEQDLAKLKRPQLTVTCWERNTINFSINV